MWLQWIKSALMVVAWGVLMLSIKIILVVPQDQPQANFMVTNHWGVSPGALTPASLGEDNVLLDEGLPYKVLPPMQRPQ